MAEIPIKPPWVNDDPDVPPSDIGPRDDKGRFVPGVSGNPAGREKGSKNKRTLLREELEAHGAELAQAIKRKALDGDSSCMSMWLARLEPPLRSTSARSSIEDFDPDAPVTEQSKQIITAAMRGDIDIDTAKELFNLLSMFVGLKDVESFLAELRKLKQARGHQEIPGGVVTT